LGPMAVPETSYRMARLAGADSFWLPDHLNNLLPRAVMTTKYSGSARLIPDVDAVVEPWTALGYLAGRHRFNRTRLGTCVTDTGRRNPAVTAQAAATLYLMTRGRTVLGIGTGEREGNEPYGWTGPSESGGPPHARPDEHADSRLGVRRLWITQTPLSRKGCRQAANRLAPLRPPSASHRLSR